MPSTRTVAAARYSLKLGGVDCGDVKTVSGGWISAPVIEEPVSGGFTRKHLGPPRYEEVTVEVGLASAPDLYAWMSSAWTLSPQRRDGSIVVADANGKVESERRFTNALITAVAVPELDASSKDAAHLTVTFRPELVRTEPGAGRLAAGTAKPLKRWLRSNFRLELDGLETTRVASIDSFTVTQPVAADPGGTRDAGLAHAVPRFPNLVVAVSAADAKTWEDWFEDFVVEGNSSQEKSGAIVLLAPDLHTEIGRVALHGVGICALRMPAPERGSGQIARVSVELYCEQMELHVGASAPAPTPPPSPPVVPLRPRPSPIVPHR